MASLLFDENLSPRLAASLADIFPGSMHVRDCALKSSPDADIWAFAGARGLIITSKDADFVSLAALRGSPPKIVWVRAGNSTTSKIAALLRVHAAAVEDFAASPASILALG